MTASINGSTGDIQLASFTDINNFLTLSEDDLGLLNQCRSVGDFEKLNRLGEGTYGIVYRARDTRTKEIVALKKLRIDQSDLFLPNCLREINILMECIDHENVIRLREIATGRSLTSVFLVMDYCEQDLAFLIDNMRLPFTESQNKCLMLQLFLGLEYLHEKFIVHRDLKMSNLLLHSNGSLKIADFGLARYVSVPCDKKLTPLVATLWYRPPEILFGSDQQTSAIDMWAAGCILGELLKHKPLLPGKSEIEQIGLIIDFIGSPSKQLWPEFDNLPNVKSIEIREQPYNNIRALFPDLSEAGIRLLNALFFYNPERRVSAIDAAQCAYFKEQPFPCIPSLMPSFPELRNKRFAKQI